MIKLLLGGWPRDWGAAVAVTGLVLASAFMFAGFMGTAANTFGLIRSVIDVIMLYSVGTAIGVTITGYLIYMFVLKSVKAEHQGAVDAAARRE